MQTAVSTCDLYEGAYYLIHGCEITAVEGVKIDGRLACRLTVEGENLPELQLCYLQGKAQANLFVFRRTYGHLNVLVQKAKRRFRRELRAEPETDGEPS